ncbi:MAG: zinc transporter substrate-binding protein [Actinotalea sp.]|nr:zinc transporter substrate-binding protein [Actinotalea sp.]
MWKPLTRPLGACAAVAALATTAACAPSGGAEGGAGDRLTVLASFYPLQYVVEQVGGDLVDVASLTPPGIEPHDIELSARQLQEVADADVVVVLGGFQPAVDKAVAAQQPEHLVDAATTPSVAEHLGAEGSPEAEGSEDDGHGHDGADPHFWLDPTLLADVAEDVATALAEAQPGDAEAFRDRADGLAADLSALDQELAAGLATCERRVVVTAHEAFGFLAERYDLEQVGISGLDPEAEPSPARLREIGEVVADHGVTTLFTEELLNPKVSETLADDLGIRTAVLDPIENRTDPADDYRGAMEQNLAALREALACT